MKAKFNFLPLAFFTSAAQYDQCPDGQFKEIAFVGASNAGKSSAINALSNNKKLAKISKTPGKLNCLIFLNVGKVISSIFQAMDSQKCQKPKKKNGLKRSRNILRKRKS